MQLLRQAHIRKLDILQFVNQNVARLDISVDNTILMKEMHSRDALLDHRYYKIGRIQFFRVAQEDRTEWSVFPVLVEID